MNMNSVELVDSRASQVVRNPSANAGVLRDVGLVPGLRRSLGVGNGNPLQYSCLENPTDRDEAGGLQSMAGLQRVGHR